ncbi:MAG: hypothetical protein M3485_06405 [Pseudomonadota bacterium]|nr:hypothetical protein [Pseudomonadota bacterium]
MHRSILIISTLAIAVLGILLLGSPRADASGAIADAWGVRASALRVETLSEVNVGKPSRVGPLDTRPVASRRGAGVAIELHADATTAVLLAASADSYAPELDQALAWLQRMRPQAQPPARILLTLIAPLQHTSTRRLHDARQATVVDVVVAIDPTSPLSIEVGRALGVSLHEASHAFSARSADGQRPERRDDEYNASLIEACYRVDTLRLGDSLRLRPRTGVAAGEDFVTAHSRDAAREVVGDLIRASGTDTVHWHDAVAMRGLKLACALRLAHLAPPDTR